MEYQPGVRNIGSTERRKRALLGAGSLVAAVGLVAVVAVAGLSVWTLLLSAFPLYGAALGALQAREGFCVGFAARGVFDVGDGRREVRNGKAHEVDRQRAGRLNAEALAIAAAGTLLAFAAGAYAL